MLERTLAVSTDEQIRAEIVRRLSSLRADETADGARAYVRKLERAWGDDLSFVSLNAELVLGPPVEALRCVGPAARVSPVCKRDWKARLDDER